ncbi:MAG: response regulator [Schwartzia succinivorans]|nr:response regulator [Schwartzia succinivorans]
MKPLKIVIADDEAVIRMDLKEILREAGHEVVGETANGRRAVAIVREMHPDLVIMDIKMPDMDGIEAARLIAADHLAPVLLLTAFDDAELIERAKDAGVLAYLVKPVEEKNLFPAMEIALSRWQEMQSLEEELFAMRDSLETRKLLDRAKGILMQAHNISEAEAYRRMQRYSMEKRLSLKEVAAAVVKAGSKRKK